MENTAPTTDLRHHFSVVVNTFPPGAEVTLVAKVQAPAGADVGATLTVLQIITTCGLKTTSHCRGSVVACPLCSLVETHERFYLNLIIFNIVFHISDVSIARLKNGGKRCETLMYNKDKNAALVQLRFACLSRWPRGLAYEERIVGFCA